jgi:hypothetical protein
MLSRVLVLWCLNKKSRETLTISRLFTLKMVPEGGLEPPRVTPYAPQAYVSAISPPGPF